MNSKPEKNRFRSESGMIVGIVVGMAIGIGVGLAMDQFAVGIVIGVAIGTALGSAFSSQSGTKLSPEQRQRLSRIVLYSLMAGIFLLAVSVILVLLL